MLNCEPGIFDTLTHRQDYRRRLSRQGGPSVWTWGGLKRIDLWQNTGFIPPTPLKNANRLFRILQEV